MLERGWSRVFQLMSLCSYVGPAPVHAGALYGHAGQPGAQAARTKPASPGANVVAFGVAPKRSSGYLAWWSARAQPVPQRAARERENGDGARAGQCGRGTIVDTVRHRGDGQVIRVFDKHVHHTVEPRNPISTVAG